MVGNKHASKIIIALVAVAVVLCFLAIACSEKLTEVLGGTGVTMEYESKLFDTDEIITIDIQMDSDDWEKMLSNALSEEYIFEVITDPSSSCEAKVAALIDAANRAGGPDNITVILAEND